MKNKIEKRYECRLETASENDITAILDAKLFATTPEQTADYIAFSIDNLEAKKQRIKDAEAELKKIKKDVESQIEVVKIGSAEWLNSCGVEKLQGDIISSVKVVKKAQSEVLKISCSEDDLIEKGFFKMTLDKTSLKNEIKNGAEIDGVELEVTHKQDEITIYKRRK